jgi:hypothetical protein
MCSNERSICDNENDRNAFESSTYDSRLQLLGTEEKLSVCILNKKGIAQSLEEFHKTMQQAPKR